MRVYVGNADLLLGFTNNFLQTENSCFPHYSCLLYSQNIERDMVPANDVTTTG